MVGYELDRAVAGGNDLLEPAEAVQGDRSAVVRVGKVGLEADRRVVAGQRALEVARGLECAAKVIPRLGKPGVEREGAAEVDDRRGFVAERGQGDSQAAGRRLRARHQPDGLTEARERLLVALQISQRLAPAMVGLEVVGPGSDEVATGLG